MLPFTTLHWLDCNIFVEAKNGPYSFEIAPGFWRWLENASKDGLVRSPISVYNELRSWNDPLSRWAKRVKSTGMFVNPDRSVQRAFGDIAVFVQGSYESPQAAQFLACADPWVIAHAHADQSIVVTHETLAPARLEEGEDPECLRPLRRRMHESLRSLPQTGIETGYKESARKTMNRMKAVATRSTRRSLWLNLYRSMKAFPT